ncbi:hypothetical protein [Marinicella rhabdoformis]|uniref:hypothetical protein n=1 Tax=Marinicella rhabdoformis TaxID=2580566 RepID=UPI0012AECAAD|nr:hypothetical protein [Marinicella rhabdoformis]
MKFKVITMTPCLFLGLVACGSDQSSSPSGEALGNGQQSAKKTEPVAVSGSTLNNYMSDEKICAVIDVEDLKSTFNITTEIKSEQYSYGSNFTCKFMWDRADSEAREKLMLDNMMVSAQNGGKGKLSMRQKVPSSELSISLSEARRKASNYVPRKLSPEQLQAQIDAAKAAAEKRLTADQKAVAGDMANDMVEKMMKKNNENQVVDGVGDAAYWSKVGFGGLNVLSGDVNVSIAPMIGDTEEADIENAKLVFNLFKK